jgi:hypothetical protein
MLRAALRAVLATLLLAACTDDAEDQSGLSVFAGNISGTYSAPLAGRAVFGVTLDDAANAAGFSLVLGEGGAARIALFAYTTPKPRVGTYEIVAPGSPATSDTVFQGSLTYIVNDSVQAFEIHGGTITLDQAGHNRTAGSFELQARRIRPADNAEVSIEGTFDAAQIPQVFPQQREPAP